MRVDEVIEKVPSLSAVVELKSYEIYCYSSFHQNLISSLDETLRT